MEFYVCTHCGNIITKLTDKKVPVVCCGEKMQLLTAGTTDAALEKHVPVYTVENNTVHVKVGSVEHPMTEAHWIEWIIAETNHGFSVRQLTPLDKPEADFILALGEELKEVYAYCNLHGLWKAEI